MKNFTLALRWSLSACLLSVTWLNAHWSVALCLSLIFITNEANEFRFARLRRRNVSAPIIRKNPEVATKFAVERDE
jgi:hypothetical protein